jgi:NADH:ubiquinone oxidoreductase subunit 2 (subunit N)
MLLTNTFYTSNVLLFTYMFIYNITLILVFWIITSNLTSNMKTLYSFSSFSFDSHYLFFLTVAIFSMAGVPPFIGFFSKLFILNLLINSNLFLFYFIFFVLLFVGLYFYIQNMRFLHTSNLSYSNKQYFLNERNNIFINYFAVLVMFLLIFGVSYLDDVLLLFTWMLL